MKAGREMDALVAEKVMGWTDRHGEFAIPPDTSPHRGAIRYMPEKVPPYSTDISAAWQVVEKLWADRNNVWVEWAGTVWICGATSVFPDVEADTAQLAICLAALKACGVEVESPK